MPVVVLVAVLVAVLVTATAMMASCGSTTPAAEQTTAAPTSTTAPTTTAAPTTTDPPTTAAPATTTTASGGGANTGAPAGDPLSAEDAEAVRDVVMSYWEAYNAYDPDRAVSHLDEGYRPTKEQAVRDEIGRIKTFGVQLGVSEQSPPVLIGPDAAEMHLDMKEPLGTRTIVMRLVRQGGSWAITYSEEAK